MGQLGLGFLLEAQLWEAHGETVTRAVPFLPLSFGHASANPAKSLSSRFKAWEHQQYIYGMGPTSFSHILPQKYWINFCKLVSGICILQCHSIPHKDLMHSHKLSIDFVTEFEELYYQ